MRLVRHILLTQHYIVTYRLSVCAIFSQNYIIKDTIVDNNVLSTKCEFRFSPQSLSENVLIIRNIQRDVIGTVLSSSCKPYVAFVRF